NIVHAYERGRRAASRQESVQTVDAPVPGGSFLDQFKRKESTEEPLPIVPAKTDYPLITTLSDGAVKQYFASPPEPTHVAVRWLADDLESLQELLHKKLVDGGCAAVICNTVRRAVERYEHLRGVFGNQVTLTHSRFIAYDRATLDAQLLEDFGPDSGAVDRDGRIVVATQVVEQSLDVDFDVMVTDLAPIDLIVQRSGRLHRHSGRQRPGLVSNAELYVTGFDPDGAAEVEKGGAVVYGEHLLLRSAALIRDVATDPGHFVMPSDVPALVQRAYGDEPLGPESWHAAMASAAKKAEEAHLLNQKNSSVFCIPGPGPDQVVTDLIRNASQELDTDDGAQQHVRRGDGSFEVIVLVEADDGLALLPQFNDDRVIPTHELPDRETVHLLAQSFARLPGWLTHAPQVRDAVLDELSQDYFQEWQKDPIIGQQLILLLDESGRKQMGDIEVTYDLEIGLEVHRVDQ